MNVKRMTREPQVVSRLSGKIKAFVGCVPKPIPVLETSFPTRVLTSNVMTLKKRNI